MKKYCQCGCGIEIKEKEYHVKKHYNPKYISGHHSKLKFYKEKHSKDMKGCIPHNKNKTFEETYGIEGAKELKDHISKSVSKYLLNAYKTGKRFVTDKTRESVSKSNLGKIRTEEEKLKNRLAHLGKKQSKETINKRIKSLTGKHRTIEIRRRMSESSPKKEREIRKCLICGNDFKCRIKESKKLCSIICFKKQNIGKKQSKETIEKKVKGLKLAWKNGKFDHLMENKVSKAQINLYKTIQLIYPSAQLNRIIHTKDSVRFADILIERIKLIIEYDYSFYHKQDRDKIRDNELLEIGYKVIHYVDYLPSEVELRQDIMLMLNSENKILYKDGNYKITHLEAIKWFH